MANSDSIRSINEQVGHAGWENIGFNGRVIVVRGKIDGVFVDIGHEFFSEFSQAALSVTIGCR